MSCPQEPTPAGWKVWQGPVPTELTQQAMDIRDHVRSYARGSFAKQMQYGGQTVGFWVSSHTWTWRNGVLVTGLCIPGVSILVLPVTGGAGATPPPDLSTPDPTAAMYGADDVPVQGTDWGLVAASAVAIVATATAFVLALKLAGRPRLR